MKENQMLLESIQPSRAICKCCGKTAFLYDVCDFNKNCEEAKGKFLPLSGIPIYYHKCSDCGFIFTKTFDHYSIKDFQDLIYNDKYLEVDPEFLSIRPQNNANLIESLFSSYKEEIRVLDYGGGNGALAEHLRQKGFRNVTTFEPFNEKYDRKPNGVYNLIVAFEVVEHLPSPYKTFEDAISFLDHHRGLFMFSTVMQPNNIDKAKAGWWYIAPRNGHISIYTFKSIHSIMDKLKLKFSPANQNLHFAFQRIPDFAKHIITYQSKQ